MRAGLGSSDMQDENTISVTSMQLIPYTLLGLLFVAGLFWLPFSPAPLQTTSQAVAFLDIPMGIPTRIKISSIQVDAPVESVGLTSKGAVGIPSDPANVAWYNLGPRPGERGSAVIVGHFGWKNNLPAVFDNLPRVQEGDLISTEDDAGKAVVFVVRSIRTYGSDETIQEVFASDDGKAHLNLITCTGVWDVLKQTYSQRLVVFAERQI